MTLVHCLPQGPVYDVDWTSRPSGRGLLLAAACTDSVVRCWEVCEGGGEEELKQEASIRQLAVLKGHKGRVLTVCWSHRHRNCATDDWLLLSGGEDQTLRYWCPEALAAAEAEEEEQAGSQDVQQSALDSAIPPGEEQVGSLPRRGPLLPPRLSSLPCCCRLLTSLPTSSSPLLPPSCLRLPSPHPGPAPFSLTALILAAKFIPSNPLGPRTNTSMRK